MRFDLHHRFRLGLVFIILLLGFAPTVHAAPAVNLVWDANTEADLGGYVVSYGTQPGVYTVSTDVGNQTAWSTSSLEGGLRYYFAVQAYNTAGMRSTFSNEVDVYIPPYPVVSSISPAIGSSNGGTSVTITGRNFLSGAVVIIGTKAALNITVVNATTITATTPPGVAGAADVRVTNLDGQSTAIAAAFTYVSNMVTITSVAPVSGLSQGGAALVIRGTNFEAGASVLVGGTPATNVRVVGATLIAASAPAHAAGTVDVQVTLTDGRSALLAGAFTYVNGRPSTTLVTPRKGSIRGGTFVTITGMNFVSGATVTIGGLPASNVTVVTATSLTATTPLDLGAMQNGTVNAAALPRTVDVIVQNPDGQTGTLVGGFSYDIVAPVITSINPSSGDVNGGTRVTIRGTEFAPGLLLFIGGQPATDVTVSQSTLLTAVTPAHAAGVVDIELRNPDGLQTARQRLFTYVGSNGSLDTDKDGMPDVYENQMGLDPNLATGDDGANGDPDHDGQTNLAEYNAGTHPRGFVRRYFAEGVSSSFFTTVFALANPSDQDAHVLMTFMKGDGSTYGYPVSVGPYRRVTIYSKNIAAVATTSFSTMLESDQLVVADRTMTWDATGYGAHAETAIERPALTWYLAEGATHSGFDLFYLIQNPSAETAELSVKYLLPSGDPIVKTYSVGPFSRYNIWVDLEDPRLAQTDVSAVVTGTNNVPVIVERSMYMNAGGRPFGAGHNSAGVTAPATRWFLAEGATGNFFDEFVLLANPESVPADVKTTYMLPNGTTLEKTYSVPATSRYNIWLDLEDQQLANSAVSAEIESSNGVPIIVERTMWWPGPTAANWLEAHNSPGASTTSTRWALAEGEEGGAQGRSTFILLANTSPYDGQVRVTLLFEDGTTTAKVFPLLAKSRFNVAVGMEFPEAANKRFGALVESLGEAGAELVVERAMYWNANNQYWAAGTNALGTPLSAQ